MNNYRPISVISTIAKVLEKVAHNQLYLYLQDENLLSTSQHDFRPGHSNVTALLEITDRLYHNIDIGELNGVVFLDLKKAFDTVNNQILLNKLNCYSITETAHKWFASYLSNRSQYCQVNGVLLNTDRGRPRPTGPIIYNNNVTLFRPGPTLVPEVYFYYFHCEGRKLIH